MFLVENGDRFRRTAAARSFHHARRGGLVEHTSQMMRSACALTGVYKKLNRDLLVAGVLFHDSGKLWENHVPEDAFGIEHCERGELLGHINMGIEIVNSLWRQLKANDAFAAWKAFVPSSESVRLHLLHLIASHHGEMAFGSPVVPKTPEACALHYIDNLDAKMEMVFHGYTTAPDRRAEHLRQGAPAAGLPDRTAQAVSRRARSFRRLDHGRRADGRVRTGLKDCASRKSARVDAGTIPLLPWQPILPLPSFIEESVNHPDWLKVIEGGQADAIVKAAKDNGFDCSLDDLKAAAKDLLAGGEGKGEQNPPDQKKIDDAASGMSDLENDTGYGDDTGYAALYGVAGVILKM